MPANPKTLADIFSGGEFTRSGAYDAEWVLKNQMGPNVLWLAEGLAPAMDLHPGMRVLDLGCGRALSSIFLAREFNVQVWAADLWIKPTENWERVRDAGLEEQVFPVYAEAHSLPFADHFFDAIISLDAYHYFGTDDLYIGYIARFLKPGGQLGIVVPGVQEELIEGVPEHLQPYWNWEFGSFHSPVWWRRHWEKSGKLEITLADWVPNGWEHWMKWMELVFNTNQESYAASEVEMLRLDSGKNLGFSRILAHT